MKQLVLNANSNCLSKKIYWKILQEVLPPQIPVSTLRWMLYGPPTLDNLQSWKVSNIFTIENEFAHEPYYLCELNKKKIHLWIYSPKTCEDNSSLKKL